MHLCYELGVNDTTDTQYSASYLDLHIEIDKGGNLKTKPYDKRDDLNFPIVNIPSSVAIFQHDQRMKFEFEQLAPLQSPHPTIQSKPRISYINYIFQCHI